MFDPLTALIASDLIYWIATQGKRWEIYKIWAEWFGVSYDSIKSRNKNLSVLFVIGKTTRIIAGGRKVRGGNMYELRNQFRHLAEIVKPVSERTIKTAVFPLQFIEISTKIYGDSNIKFAWFLCRIGYFAFINKTSHLNYVTLINLAKLTQTDKRTLKRYLVIAEQENVLKVLDNDGFVIGLTKIGLKLLSDPFTIIAQAKQQKITDARLAGIASFCEEIAPFEHVVDWAANVAEDELGKSLGEFIAERDGLSDEWAGYDQLLENCNW